MLTQFRDKEILSLATKIKNDIYIPTNISKTTIFLCGASLEDKTKLRGIIADKLLSQRQEKSNYVNYTKYNYNIVYPEEIFEELLFTGNFGEVGLI